MEHYKELLATLNASTQIEIDAEEEVKRVTKSCKIYSILQNGREIQDREQI